MEFAIGGAVVAVILAFYIVIGRLPRRKRRAVPMRRF